MSDTNDDVTMSSPSPVAVAPAAGAARHPSRWLLAIGVLFAGLGVFMVGVGALVSSHDDRGGRFHDERGRWSEERGGGPGMMGGPSMGGRGGPGMLGGPGMGLLDGGSSDMAERHEQMLERWRDRRSEDGRRGPIARLLGSVDDERAPVTEEAGAATDTAKE